MEEKDIKIFPDKELDKGKDFNLDSLSNTISETHNNTEPGLENVNVVNKKYNEEMVKELQDCLPIWVSQDQVLDLLTRSSGNIVEAVSDFYERETEYHDQVIAFRMNAASVKSERETIFSQTNTPVILVPKLVSTKGSSNGSVKSSLNKETVKKQVDVVKSVGSPMKRGSLRSTLFPKRKSSVEISPKKKDSNKSTISPKKNVSATGLQSSPKKKKGKPSSTMQPTNGSKQSTITKFFNKI